MAKSDITKGKIEDALLDMLSQKNIDDITVGEFIEFANISRSTFYRYYHDIYDVYENLIAIFADKCMKSITIWLNNEGAAQLFANNITSDWRPIDKDLLDDNDFRFFNHIVSGNLSTPILRKLDFYFTKMFYEYLISTGIDADRADFFSRFILKTLLASYSYAFVQGKPFSAEPLDVAFKAIRKLELGWEA